VLAAAAVAAVAIGAVVVATDQPTSRPRPNPPATHVSTPPTSAPTPAPSATPTHTVAAPPYLPAGQTGSRSQVPWSIVGSGWRLLQPDHVTSAGPSYDHSLYLYDPVGGSYLITDSLPTGARLVGWSPDGTRAMFAAQGGTRQTYYQLQLRSGSTVRVLRTGPSSFLSYTRPSGLAFLIQNFPDPPRLQLVRYSVSGAHELTYPAVIGSKAISGGQVVYTGDGSELVVPTQDLGSMLIGNDGSYLRTFRPPAGMAGCTPIKLWNATTILEYCSHVAGSRSYAALALQPLSGAQPTTLIDTPGRLGAGYLNAWQLGNGDALLENSAGGCSDAAYDILPKGSHTARPLSWPSSIGGPASIVDVTGDIATFLQQTPSGCTGSVPRFRMLDYYLSTGQIRTLFDGFGIVLDWPGDQS